ncbi:MAG: hypothetical protein QY329_07815 [Anaerolineales bacterium]|nr:MAG: hypothetical protein QY329_07815 [Anaerolineales bacterium]
MELLLALAVITAVICFGALISFGNEKQRRALNELREQVVLWAIQDLRIKRERLARNVRVDDPLGWLSRTAEKILGPGLNLKVVEFFQDPPVLVCSNENENHRVFFSPLSPDEVKGIRNARKNRLANPVMDNPLLSLPGKVVEYQLSTLNCGFLFDAEFELAWKGITGHSANKTDRLWMYLPR